MSHDTAMLDRIMSRMKVESRGYRTPCWISDRAQQPNGYTKIGVQGKTKLVHRVAFEAEHGPIPDGLVIDHLCRQRACCNPEHLEPVTNRVNLLRGDTLTAREASMTSCVAGHQFNKANTRFTAKGKRACRSCDASRARAYRRSSQH